MVVMGDPELADAPDTPADMAWEIRHCAARFEDLAELAEDVVDDDRRQTSARLLNAAATTAKIAAAWVEGVQP